MKLPSVERCPVTGGLKGSSAYAWCIFLCEEADWIGDTFGYARFRSIADILEPKPGKPETAAFYSKDLEEAIEAWSR